jgi:hypothetical protein
VVKNRSVTVTSLLRGLVQWPEWGVQSIVHSYSKVLMHRNKGQSELQMEGTASITVT